MFRLIPLLLLILAVPAAAQDHFPGRHHWETVEAAAAGFDTERLAEAVSFARAAAVTEPSDLYQVITDSFAPREPNFRILGPTAPRAGDSGIILRGCKCCASRCR